MPVIALVLDENFLQILEAHLWKYVPKFFRNGKGRSSDIFSFCYYNLFIKNLILVITEYLKSIFINSIKENNYYNDE